MVLVSVPVCYKNLQKSLCAEIALSSFPDYKDAKAPVHVTGETRWPGAEQETALEDPGVLRCAFRLIAGGEQNVPRFSLMEANHE